MIENIWKGVLKKECQDFLKRQKWWWNIKDTEFTYDIGVTLKIQTRHDFHLCSVDFKKETDQGRPKFIQFW